MMWGSRREVRGIRTTSIDQTTVELHILGHFSVKNCLKWRFFFQVNSPPSEKVKKPPNIRYLMQNHLPSPKTQDVQDKRHRHRYPPHATTFTMTASPTLPSYTATISPLPLNRNKLPPWQTLIFAAPCIHYCVLHHNSKMNLILLILLSPNPPAPSSESKYLRIDRAPNRAIIQQRGESSSLMLCGTSSTVSHAANW
jgi:hypothetical protein